MTPWEAEGFQISPESLDALREAFNIAFGHAAAALARLVQRRILLSPPLLQVVRATQITEVLEPSWRQYTGVVVYQSFLGLLEGTASLLVSLEGGQELLKLLLTEPPLGDLSPSDIDVLTEIGNIVFGALISVLSNLLQAALVFDPPEGKVVPLEHWWRSPPWEVKDDIWLIVVRSQFQVSDSTTNFLLIVAVEALPFRRLQQALERLVL